MIQNYFTRCAIQGAPLYRLKEKILNTKDDLVFTCDVRRYRGKSYLGLKPEELIKKIQK